MSMTSESIGELLPHLTTLFNATSALFLGAGFVLIKRGKIEAHKKCMLAAFSCSVLFLVLYLTRYALTGDHPYPGDGPARNFYLILLFTHVSLAAIVPFMAMRTLYLGLKGQHEAHRRWGRRTFPIWMYVSVTGVIV